MKRLSASERLQVALAKIDDPSGEGKRACITVYRDAALAAASASDARRRGGLSRGSLDGVIVTIKDLFDVAGEVTRAGSGAMARHGRPAQHDAQVTKRLRSAGAVIVAKTNMSEFAFSGMGDNPHFGTPRNPADRLRVPGGSTSGGAVSVADGMCAIAVGSDTGGSTRIPAALCGIVGFKPTKSRIPTDEAFPLSLSFDSIGPMAPTVAACADADAVMANDKPTAIEPISLSGLRIAVMRGMPTRDLDDAVAERFEVALEFLKGARLSDEAIGLLDAAAAVNSKGGLVAPEAARVHSGFIEEHGEEVDPNIRARIERGRAINTNIYIEMATERARLVKAMDERLAELDAIVLPTCPIVAPTILEAQNAEVWARKNAMVLRNTSLANFFDLTAISLPIPGSGLPVGLMLMARNNYDRRLFQIAAAVERRWAV
jgi:aspartyl-tRNA(Asn)/glutamyl-tRNA(Gln) amidotransferase subunit A